jgi:hypothetical protein
MIKKAILSVLFLVVVSFGMSDITVPFTFSDSGIIYASEHNANFDSLRTAINRNKDTVEAKFIRFTDFSSGDSTLKRLQVDTIRSNPDIDSIRGLNVVRGNPDIDSISGSPIIDAITVTGAASADSLYSTSAIKAVRVIADSIVTGNNWFKVESGTFACTLTIDSGFATGWSGDDTIGVGKYYKIGKMVNIELTDFAALTNIGYVGTGIVKLKGVPPDLVIHSGMRAPHFYGGEVNAYCQRRNDYLVMQSLGDPFGLFVTQINYAIY